MKHLVSLGIAAALSVGLGGCNSSSSGSAPPNNPPPADGSDNPPAEQTTTVSGTAAIGAAIANAPVSAKCQDGKGFEQAVTTDDQGRYSGVIIRSSFPCAFKVTHEASGQTYYSYAPDTEQTTVNLTPLTSLVIARAKAQSPDDWFSADHIALNAQAYQQAVEALIDELKTATDDTAPTTSPVSTPFSIGDAYDRVLDKFAEALKAQNRQYNDFLINYRDGNAFGLNLGKIVIDDSVKDPEVPSGNYRLTITTTVMGSSTNVVLENMPKPANQAEFCGNYNEELAAQGYQINSCTFDGQIGVIDSTLSTNGFSMSYQNRYEYTPS
ncbi:MAG: hypothetical protein WCS28_00420 [Thiomicrospira sp.]|jgi:hypothetical protein